MVIKKAYEEAENLYNSERYQECYNTLKSETDDCKVLVLKARCCDQLGRQDESYNYFRSAISLDSSAISVWLLLYKKLEKNAESEYFALITTCAKLIEHSDSLGDESEVLIYEKKFIETIIRFHLPLPQGFGLFSKIIDHVLKFEPRNVYALEAYIRLQVEVFLTDGFPSIFDPSLDEPNQYSTNFLNLLENLLNSPTYLNRLKQLESIISNVSDFDTADDDDNDTPDKGDNDFNCGADGVIKVDEKDIETARLSLMLGQFTHDLAKYYMLSASVTQTTTTFNSALDSIGDINLIVGDENNPDKLSVEQEHLEKLWIRYQTKFIPDMSSDKPFTGLQVIFGFLITFKLGMFYKRHSMLQKISDYIEQYEKESVKLCNLPQKYENLKHVSRPLCIPFYLNRNCETSQIWTEYIFLISLLNASYSESYEIAMHTQKKYYSEFKISKDKVHWSNIHKTLCMECSLTSTSEIYINSFRDFWGTNQMNYSKKFASSFSFPENSSIRYRICFLWLRCLVFNSSCSDELKDNYYKSTVCMVTDLIRKFEFNFNSRDYYLVGRVIDLLNNYRPVELSSYLFVLCSRGIQKDSRYFGNYFRLGVLFRRNSELLRTFQSFKRAYELSPQLSECIYNYVIALCDKQEWDEALAIYSSLKEDQFTEEMWLNYGLITLRLGRMLECVPILQKLCSTNPQKPLYWEILGEAYLSRKSYETSIKSFNKALQLGSDHPFIYILLARAHRNLTNYFEAIQSVKTAMQCIENSQYIDTKSNKFHILAMKELAELELFQCRTNLHHGLCGIGLEELQNILILFDKLLGCFVGKKVVPYWFYRYVGSAFSLLTLINDPELIIMVPYRLASLMKDFSISSQNSSSPLKENELVPIKITTCIQLASLYLACALRCWISSIENPNESEKTDPSTSPKNALITVFILTNLALHHINQAYYHKHNNLKYEFVTQLNEQTITFNLKDLCILVESCLKKALTMLDQLFIIYEKLLNEILTEKSSFSSDMDDDIEENDTRERLNSINQLRSKAWAGLASLFNLDEKNSEQVDYCLCQSLLIDHEDSTVMSIFAMRQLKQGRTELADALIKQAQATDPENFKVWAISAQMAEILSDGPSVDPNFHVNIQARDYLLRAAYAGPNSYVSIRLVSHILPYLIQLSQSTFVSNNNDPSELVMQYYNRRYLRFMLDSVIFSLDHATAYQPSNIYLWHALGIFYQLTGLSSPSMRCFKKAVSLLTRNEYKNNEKLNRLILSQYFLITFICGKPDWEIKNKLLCLHTSNYEYLAEICALGIIYMKQSKELNLARQLLINCREQSSFVNNSIVAKCALNFQSQFGLWLFVIYSMDDNKNVQNIEFLSLLNKLLLNSKSTCLSYPLIYNLSFIGCKLDNSLFHSLKKEIYEISLKKQFEYDELINIPDRYKSIVNDYYVRLGGQLSEHEYEKWISNNAELCISLFGLNSGLSYVSNYLIQQPSESSHWILLVSYFVKIIRRLSNSSKINTYLALIFRCLQNIELFNRECPMTPILSLALAKLTKYLLSKHGHKSDFSNIFPQLVKHLKLAAFLFPDTPNILHSLIKISSFYS